MKKQFFLRFILWLIRRFMKKPGMLGLENIEAGSPAVFVSNHLGYYAPLKLIAFSGFALFPWVTSEVTDRKACGSYLIGEFLEPDLKLKKPWSNLLAAVISPLCIFVMGQLQAVPVYHKSRDIFKTMEISMRLLGNGKTLLIFPETAALDRNCLGEFNSGFVYLAKLHFERTGKAICFYPVSVNKESNQIIIGKQIRFDPTIAIWDEKNRIAEGLRQCIIHQLAYKHIEEQTA